MSAIRPSESDKFEPVFTPDELNELSHAPQASNNNNQSQMMDHIKQNISKKLLSDSSIMNQM
jgi:hypothetical protein